MTACNNCHRDISDNNWFCDYCGKERPDCLECGTRLRFHECPSCSAAPSAPCEECGTQISGDLRECPHCGYDAGATYEEKSKNWSHSKLLVIGGGTLLLLIVTQALISLLSGFLPGGIFRTGFQLMSWFFALLAIGAWLIVGGSVSVLSDYWGSHRQSQAERATAADIEQAEQANQSAEYKEELRRQREREREREQKKEKQRHKELVQCPNCGKLVHMRIEGQVTDVQSDADGSLGMVGTALDTLGADSTKECPRCTETVMVETELA